MQEKLEKYISCQQIPLQIPDRSPNRKKIQSYFHFVQQFCLEFSRLLQIEKQKLAKYYSVRCTVSNII